MKLFYRYYLITTQIIAFMLVPPIIAYVLCRRLQARSAIFITSLILATVGGVSLAIIFAYRVFIKLENKEGKENKV